MAVWVRRHAGEGSDPGPMHGAVAWAQPGPIGWPEGQDSFPGVVAMAESQGGGGGGRWCEVPPLLPFSMPAGRCSRGCLQAYE